jgi:hypothetical protein
MKKFVTMLLKDEERSRSVIAVAAAVVGMVTITICAVITTWS